MRKLLLLFVVALVATGQSSLTIFSVPDVSGTGSVVQLAASGTARWCQLVAPAGNVSVVRWGDSSITASRGAVMAAGAGQFIPPMGAVVPPGGATVFQLSSLYVLVQSGDSLTATCGR